MEDLVVGVRRRPYRSGRCVAREVLDVGDHDRDAVAKAADPPGDS